MNALSGLEWLSLFLICALAAGLGLWLAGTVMRNSTSRVSTAHTPSTDSHFLLDGDELVGLDAVDLPAHHPIHDAVDWPDIRTWLSSRFPDLPEHLPTLPDSHTTLFECSGSTLHVERQQAKTKLTLANTAPHSAAAWFDLTLDKENDQHALAALNAAPDPIWRTDASGTVIWQNGACQALIGESDAVKSIMEPHTPRDDDAALRFFLDGETGAAGQWYEVRQVQVQDDVLHFASNVTAVVEAETAQRAFVQTLTKTFANLTTGLAIFDKSRKLALFNPALLNLTRVPVDFLSAQPDLMDFFDRLREEQVLPEPKNYADWRTQIRDAVAQANDGLYQDLWTLPNGLSYRITGRPYPDGAVAFLFEDISAEVSLTRRFRTQIELRQSVLDKLDDAIAVFAPNNLLMFCNTPCTSLLNVDPESSFADMTLRDLIRAARSTFMEEANWLSYEDQLLNTPEGPTDTVTLHDTKGRRFTCRLVLLAGGVRMLVFSRLTETTATKSMPIAS